MDNLKKYFDSISPLQQTTWDEVKKIFREQKLNKGEFFIREGSTAKEFAFLKSGVIRAFYTNNEGKEYNKRFFTNPSIIGSYSSLISGMPSLFSQQSLTNCELLLANYDKLVALYDTFPDLERLGRKFAENYFVSNEAKEVEIVLQNADKRYLDFRKQFPELEQIVPQYHIASYLGITPTQLSRIRKNIR